MTLTLNDEQQLLRDAAQSFFDDNSPISRMRELRDQRNETGYSTALWKEMADLGWLGIHISEAHGGSGMGMRELAVIMGEVGRVLAPEPFLSTVLLGANAVQLSTNDVVAARVLPAVASGDRLLALALDESGRFDPFSIRTEAIATDGGYVVNGDKRFVLDGHVADQIIVVARGSGASDDRDGLVLLLVDADADGVAIQRTTMIDGRNAANVSFRNVMIAGERVLGDAELLEQVLDRATIGLAAEMVGTVDAAFEQTLQYLKEREQFGVKIGTFQALRHRAAEMFAELEFARSLVLDGLVAVDEQRHDLALSASAAKAQANKAARLVAAEAVQMHGGMGVTDELDIGLFFKRLRTAEVTLGDTNYHLRRFARLQGY